MITNFIQMSILKKVYNELIGMDNLLFHGRMPKLVQHATNSVLDLSSMYQRAGIANQRCHRMIIYFSIAGP